MKKIALLALAATTAAVATPASAQVTGTVEVTGNVAARCSVVPVGTSDSTFEDTIDIGTLDEADGTLKASLETSNSGTPAGTVVSTRVVCNSASATISVGADTLSTGAEAPTGYANDINYTAELEVNTTAGLRYATYNTLTPVLANYEKTVGRLAAGTANNVKVRAYALAAEDGPTSLLVAGDYTSTINVTISPVAADVTL